MSYKSNTRIINVRLPETLLRLLEDLVNSGYFSSKSEAVRFFIRQYLERGDRIE
ncbi:ribbon-helix-helix protein, CopG family [Candidatus Woesearchaeota archaeon]|nr:ribbon-helix-helix protein, CopG family [Candidatus Woesearchaeota archaeon]